MMAPGKITLRLSQGRKVENGSFINHGDWVSSSTSLFGQSSPDGRESGLDSLLKKIVDSSIM